MKAVRSTQQAAAQRGVASLLVVLLLFFILSLTAAYASRNLIFEQKTSANHSRSTMAFEAAEAGVEWTLAQLNGGLLNDNCGANTPTLSFQQRYLAFNADGLISQRVRAGSSTASNIWPTCVFNGTDWTCTCPDATGASPTAPSGNAISPAYRVWLSAKEATSSASSPWDAFTAARPGLLAVSSVGCTRLPASNTDTCLDYLPGGESGEGLSAIRTTLALRSGLQVAPAAAIAARKDITITPALAKVKVVNVDSPSGGVTVVAGGTISSLQFEAETLPGTPGETSMLDSAAPGLRLTELETNVATAAGSLSKGDRMFVSTFGMRRETYQAQPGLRRCANPCSAANVNTLLQNNPNRIIWVEGNLSVDADIGTPGTPGVPVLLIVNGASLTLVNSAIIYGFVYITGGGGSDSTLTLPDAQPEIQGALVAEGNLVLNYAGGAPSGSNGLKVTYNPAALHELRTTYGSWVRLNGSWRDFKVP